MKKIIFTLFIIHCSLIIANAQWVNISCGLYDNTDAQSIVKHNSFIFSGFWGYKGHIYRTSNAGIHWDSTSTEVKDAEKLYSFNSRLFVAGIDPLDILFSTNNGDNWVRTYFNKYVSSFADNGTKLFAGCVSSYGVWYTSNNGTNWIATSLNNIPITSLTYNNAYLFAGYNPESPYFEGGIYVSSNEGANWSLKFSYSTNALTSTGNYVFAGCSSSNRGVFYSTNYGQNWIQTSLNNKTILTLYSQDSYIFAGTSGEIYVSSDYGQTWLQTISLILNWDDVISFLKDGNHVYAGVRHLGIYHSSNNGLNWTKYLNANESVESFYKFNNNLFSGNHEVEGDGGVFISTNNGVSFNQLSIRRRTITGFSSSGNTLYVCDYSANGGTYGLAYSSTDMGNNWQTIFQNNNYRLTCINAYNNNIYIGCMDGGGLWKSSNNGNNWSRTSIDSIYVYGIEVFGNRVIAGCAGGVWVSTNNGDNWHQSSLNSGSIRALSSNGTNLYALTTHGVCYSTNQGENWVQSTLDTGNYYKIHSYNRYVLVGGLYGLVFSQDYGNTWTNCSQNLSGVYIRSVFISNDFVYAGAYQNGLWRRPLSELVNVRNITTDIPTLFILDQNYPNPFNPTTTIKFDIPKLSNVKIAVYDVTGKEIEVLVNEQLQAGTYQTNWNATNFSSGVYFYRLQTEDFSETKKLILLK
ncbi:MAG TPA: T9SS type A sorting domain-containing protein [Ignavibacteria bacterium]